MRSRISAYKRYIPLLDQGLVSGGNFLVGVLLTRSLGLDFYGEFTLAWLIVLFAASVQQAAILNPLYTFAPAMKGEDKKDYLGDLTGFQWMFAAFAAVACYIILRLNAWLVPSWELTSSSLWLPFTLFTFLVHDFFRKLNYAKDKVLKSFLMDIMTYSLQVVCLLIVSHRGTLDLRTALIILGVSFSVSILFSWRELTRALLSGTKWSSIVSKHWDFSKWLVGTALLQWFSGNIFILVAAALLSPLAVGAIRIIQNIMGLLHVLFLAFENIVPLRASKIFHEDGLRSLGIYLGKILVKGGLGTLAIGGTVALFGKEIMDLLYEGQHMEFAYLLYGFAGLYVLVFTGTIIRFAIRTLEQTRLIFISYIISALASMLLAKPMIAHFGINGVIIGLVLSQLIIQAYFIYSLRTYWSKI